MFRLVDKTGDLIVATEYIEIALRLLRTIDRAWQVLDAPRYATMGASTVPLAWGT